MEFVKDNDHHWDFLEEIEAPMWVDLSIEAKSVHHNVDENWFFVSHQIHQSSASQIRASYKQAKEAHAELHFELEGPSSPKLPSSVSRSRGKDYKSKNWGVENKSYVSNNQHPIKRLGRKPINEGLGSRHQAAEPKTNGRNLKLSRDCGSNSTRSTVTNNSETIPCTGSLRRSLHPVTSKLGERKSGSIVTLTSTRQQQKSSAISFQTVSGTTELSLATRIALRKSCVSRQASRVEINDERHVIGRQSSPGKSSVGSSSSLGFIIQNKELTKKEVAHGKPDIGSVVDNCRTANTKVKSDVSRASTSQLASRSSYCTKPKGAKTVLTECAQQGAAKSKIIRHPTRRKALLPRRDNEQDPETAHVKAGDKFQVSTTNKCAAADKENTLLRRLGAEQRVKAFPVKPTEPKKGMRKGLAGSKGKASEFEGQSSRRVIHNRHFR